MLPSDVLDHFRKGKLELWCPKMVLRQMVSGTPTEYKGSGLVRHNPDRQLECVLVEGGAVSYPELARRTLSGASLQVGKFIPRDKYFSLEATDLYGWLWRAERLQISPNVGPGGSTISSDIFLLEHEESVQPGPATLALEVLDEVEIPFNTWTEKAVRVGGNETKASFRNVAKLKVGPIEFSLTKDDKHLVVQVSSQGNDLPPYAETRAIEALQFVTARSLSWELMQKRSGDKETTSLLSPTRKPLPGRMSPPLSCNQHDIGGRWTWSLFGKYFEHIVGFHGDNRFHVHPLSAWLGYVRNACAGSTFAKGLALGVAVEGILLAEFPEIGKMPPDQEKALDELTRHLNSWNGDERIRARVSGAIGAMRPTRAKDRLQVLQAAGVVRAEDVAAWDAIRNRGAHARPPEKGELQEWIDNSFRVEVLLYHLIFKAIGYEGQFTDYGSKGWPAAAYPLSALPA